MIKNLFLTVALLAAWVPAARAGVFNIPQFVEYKDWAMGVEPEFTLATSSPNSGTGFALNAKYTYGITPLSNLQIGIGPGSGKKGFRFGATYTFDLIPDLSGQLGAGVAFQAYYFSLRNSPAKVDTTVYPYLHKMFTSASGLRVDPFLALPFGVSLGSPVKPIWQLALGTSVKTSDHLSWIGELGLDLNNSDTYLSFGVSYRD